MIDYTAIEMVVALIPIAIQICDNANVLFCMLICMRKRSLMAYACVYFKRYTIAAHKRPRSRFGACAHALLQVLSYSIRYVCYYVCTRKYTTCDKTGTNTYVYTYAHLHMYIRMHTYIHMWKRASWYAHCRKELAA